MTTSTITPNVCRHCRRVIEQDSTGIWNDPEATGDDSVWREICDAHDTVVADHEPLDPREAYLAAYLVSRFFPSLPTAYAPFALTALDACEEGELDLVITLPLDLEPFPRDSRIDDDGTRKVTAGHLADILRLDRFVGEWLDI